MAPVNLNLPSHVARGLFFALCRNNGVRRGSFHHYGRHGQRRSVFERLGPRIRRNAGNGGRRFGRFFFFDSAVSGNRRQWSPIRSGRHASPRIVRLQSQPPSPRLGKDGAGPSNVAPAVVEAPAPPVVEAPAPPVVEAPAPPVDEMVAETVAVPAYAPMQEPMSPTPAPPRYWCDFCKEFALMPHTLEYSYSMPSPTPVASAPPLHPWFLATLGSRLAGRRGAQPLFSAAPERNFDSTSARHTRGSRGPHEGAGPPRSSTGRGAADPNTSAPRRPPGS
ncbi:hypothetical protein PVAP13_2KG115948 [Panicum virgatum]|uniref:Uncharacterized protein n=1 Tax=Panicum virgatum TaxID=38727 RepID=A0A8T0W444_PANVG|nr:hypothetical protein PVAP13_2KG115948 [Panicum virgatum]